MNSNDYKEDMLKPDYIDVVKVIDYTAGSFLYANRKHYHKWKLIGMAVSHTYVGGVKSTDSWSDLDDGLANGIKGVASGCLVLEEINQHNHLISRGADYLRVKIDGDNSATYGIMGNCANPDKSIDGFPSENQPPFRYTRPETVFKSAPLLNGWADPLDVNLCTCNTSTIKDWEMLVLIEIDDVEGVKRFTQTAILGPSNEKLRSCEFLSWPAVGPIGTGSVDIERAVNICVNYKDPIFNIARGSLSGSVVLYMDQGVLVKLTSLPSCNQRKPHYVRIPRGGFGSDNLGKEAICYDETDSQYNPEESFCFSKVYPERAAIRIIPTCVAYGSYGDPDPAIKIKYFDLIEKHFDRWDKAVGGGFKIFDEVFSAPDAKMRIRVITHGPKYIEDYVKSLYKEDGKTLKNPADYMKPYFLTGGNIDDRAGGAKGCSCSDLGQNEDYYPIRPYNEFVYCPNNFTGEKTCS